MVTLFCFGERVKAERKRLGLTQLAFASIANVSTKTQINYEKDERKPDADYLAKLAAAGVDVEYILTGTPSAAALTPDEIRLLSLFREATLELKAAAIGTLTAGTKANKGAKQIFHGGVGQVIKGDNSGAFTMTINETKKDKE